MVDENEPLWFFLPYVCVCISLVHTCERQNARKWKIFHSLRLHLRLHLHQGSSHVSLRLHLHRTCEAGLTVTLTDQI